MLSQPHLAVRRGFSGIKVARIMGNRRTGRQSREKDIKEREVVREKEAYCSTDLRVTFITSHSMSIAATALNSIT